MSVSSGHDERQRDATTVNQQMALVPIFPPDPSGCGAYALLCQWRLHHRPVDTLQSPSDALKLFVLGKSQLPQSLKDPGFLLGANSHRKVPERKQP